MSVQLSYSEGPAAGLPGTPADSRHFRHILTLVAEGLVAVGRSVFRVPNYGARGQNSDHGAAIAYQNPDPGAAVDVDAIMTTETLTADAAEFDQDDADGAVGAGVMMPARKLTLTTNSHADWDAGNWEVTFYNEERELVTETIAMADGGNETLTTTDTASEFVSHSVPTGSGTNRTFTMGIAALDASVTLADWEGVAVRSPMMAGTGNTADGTQAEEIADGDTFPAMRKGSVWVITEDACVQGGDVYTRIAGTGDFGAFRSDADTANAIQITGARWGMTSSAGGLNKLEMY